MSHYSFATYQRLKTNNGIDPTELFHNLPPETEYPQIILKYTFKSGYIIVTVLVGESCWYIWDGEGNIILPAILDNIMFWSDLSDTWDRLKSYVNVTSYDDIMNCIYNV